MTAANLKLVEKREYTECLICKKPLGADSRSEGFMFCHEHRICTLPGCEEPITVEEARWCLRRFEEDLAKEGLENEDNYIGIEIIHARCLNIADKTASEKKKIGAITDDPIRTIRQSELDFLNLIRLMVFPDKELSQSTNEDNARYACRRLLIEFLDFEGKSLFQKKMESYLELTQETVRRDKDYRKGFLAEREKERFEKAKKDALTSSRPTGKSSESIEEIQLATFVEANGLDPKNRDQNLKNMRLYWKTVKELQFNKKTGKPTGVSEQLAISMCKGFLAKLRAGELKTEEDTKNDSGHAG